jgi:hypothetical protein
MSSTSSGRSSASSNRSMSGPLRREHDGARLPIIPWFFRYLISDFVAASDRSFKCNIVWRIPARIACSEFPRGFFGELATRINFMSNSRTAKNGPV